MFEGSSAILTFILIFLFILQQLTVVNFVFYYIGIANLFLISPATNIVRVFMMLLYVWSSASDGGAMLELITAFLWRSLADRWCLSRR